jgi:hypothetical protein
LRIDPSTYCQLNCPACPNDTLDHTDVGKGMLDLEEYKKLTEGIERVELGNWGEPFLYPDIHELIKHSYNRSQIGMLSNLNHITDEAVDAVVRYRVERIVVSLDGASQETYEEYRVNGDFQKVLVNVERINNMKRRFKSELPHLTWQFLVFGHNEHEVSKARQMSQFLNMDWCMALPTGMDWTTEKYDCDLSPVRDTEAIRRELGFATLDEQRAKWGAFRDFGVCSGLWDEPSINWDGTMLGCCANTVSFGSNAFGGLVASLNTEKLDYAREMVQGKALPLEGIPCSGCLAYKMMERDGTWLSR